MRHFAFVLIGLMSLVRVHGYSNPPCNKNMLQKKCNGVPGLCRLKFNQVTFAGTHNSGANRIMKYNAGLFMVVASSCWYRNQEYTFTKQLDFGIRFFDIDTRGKGSEVYTSHGNTYGESLFWVIYEIVVWLNEAAHRNEVVALRFHDTTTSGYSKFGSIFDFWLSGRRIWPFFGPPVDDSVRMNDMAEWPTLDEAVAANERVFIFMVDKLCDAGCRSSHPYIRSSSRYDDTWMTRKVTSSCGRMPYETKSKCKKSTRPLIIVSAFATYGLCINHMQRYCNHHIKASADNCYSERRKMGKTVNFLIADFVNRCTNGQDVVTVTHQLNVLNLLNF